MAATDGAIELRLWRRDAHLTRQAAAGALAIGEGLLASYETGVEPVPHVVLLAARALAAGLDHPPRPPDIADARDRWVTMVDTMLAYGRGEPVVGRMLRERDFRGLEEFLGFVKKGPDPSMALTDPALFRALRAAITDAQIAGLAMFRVAREHAPRAGSEANGARVVADGDPVATPLDAMVPERPHGL